MNRDEEDPPRAIVANRVIACDGLLEHTFLFGKEHTIYCVSLDEICTARVIPSRCCGTPHTSLRCMAIYLSARICKPAYDGKLPIATPGLKRRRQTACSLGAWTAMSHWGWSRRRIALSR